MTSTANRQIVVVGIIVSLLAACSDDTTIRPNVYLLEENVISQAQVEQDKILFPASVATSIQPRVAGDIIVSDYDFGILRKITAITQTQDGLIVSTEQVSITDAVEKGSASLSVNPSEDSSSATIASRRSALSNDGPSVNLDILHKQLHNDIGLGASVEITKASIHFNPSFDASIHVDGAHITNFRAVAEGPLNAELAIKVTGKVKLAKEYTLWEAPPNLQKTYVIRIGWFPIVIVITPKILFKAEIEADVGSVEGSASGAIIAKAGLEYKDERWQGIWSKNAQFMASPPSVEGGNKSVMSISIYPQLDIKIYKVAGPYINVQPYFGVVTTSEPPLVKNEFKAALKGAAGGEVRILDKVFGSIELVLFDATIRSWTFVQDHSCMGPSSQSCGRCGIQKRMCTNGTWSAWGSCVEGMCPSMPCSGRTNGNYCGSTLPGYAGAGSDLVACTGGSVSGTSACANGCQVNQPATSDECKPMACTTYYLDNDRDMHGDRSQPGRCMASPSGAYTATVNDDCNDADSDVYSGHLEWWDVKDNNCNGQVDEDGLSKYDRWHKEWGSEDWEHRFSSSTPGSGWTNESPRSVSFYPIDICTGTYKSPTCSLISGGAYAQVRAGIQLPAIGECSGQYTARPGNKHIALYVAEDSLEYRDYQKEPGFTCRRFGYTLSTAAAMSFPGSRVFQRLRSTFNPGGHSDNLWSTSTSEPGTHADYKYGVYPEDVDHWRAPAGN